MFVVANFIPPKLICAVSQYIDPLSLDILRKSLPLTGTSIDTLQVVVSILSNDKEGLAV